MTRVGWSVTTLGEVVLQPPEGGLVQAYRLELVGGGGEAPVAECIAEGLLADLVGVMSLVEDE